MSDMTDKVRKLLAKAERAGTPEEAEAFAAKAQQLIIEHTIDTALLTDTDRDKITNKMVKLSSYYHADYILWTGVGEANNIQYVVIEMPGTSVKHVHVFGRHEDIENTELIVTSLQVQMARLSRKLQPGFGSTKDRWNWHRSFRIGFAEAIHARMQEVVSMASKTAETDNPGALPVLRDRTVAAYESMRDKYPNVREGRRRRTRINRSGYLNGQQQGSNADIGLSRVGGKRRELGA